MNDMRATYETLMVQRNELRKVENEIHQQINSIDRILLTLDSLATKEEIQSEIATKKS